ncbi:hypothetical protein [Arthrobacter sp. RIT-PI-e]|nr:hypothetical protein [Arthrobacter sp. RIT-PI-e]
MSRRAYIALILAIVGLIVFGVGAALVAVVGWDPERIYLICLIGLPHSL